MADHEVKYETKTVRAIRGMEARTASKWERNGWEVVSQSQGKIQSEITLRRPQPKSHWRLYAIGGAVLAAAFVAIIINGVISEQRDADTDAAPAPTVSESAVAEEPAEPTPSEESEPEPTPAEEEAPAVITPETNPEFAALLALGDNCDASVAAFIEQHSGETVSFDGHVASMGNHESYDTRYDILIGVGEYSETTAIGPTFLFQDVNTTFDLHWTGDNPGTIGVGDRLRITAEIVGEIYPNSNNWNCLFYLDPMSTATR